MRSSLRRRSHRRVGRWARSLSRLAVATACLAAASAAHAAFVGEATDPAGDSTSPEAAHDIVAAGFGYDRATGRMAAAVALRDAPYSATAATLVTYAGRRTATGCDVHPIAGFAVSTIAWSGEWLRFNEPGVIAFRGEADKRGGSTRVQEIEAVDRRLAGLRLDCAEIALMHPGGEPVVFDSMSVDLRPLPGLGVRLSGLPGTVRSERRHTLLIKVTNPGDAPTGRVQVRLGALRGMSAKRSYVIPSLRAGASRTIRVRVAFTRRARSSNDLTVTATAPRLKATAERRVRVSHPTRGGSGGGSGGGGGGTPSVCTQYFPDLSGQTGGSLGLVPCLR